MSIKHWPKEDRPREKLIEKGSSILTDAELMAILFKTGTKGKTALDLSKSLMNEYGHLKKILVAPPERLIKASGLGIARYATLKAAIELGYRCAHETMRTGMQLNNTHLTQQFLAAQLKRYETEVFACLFMDTQLRLIKYEELFYGTIHAAHIYPREIVRRGLLHNAAKIILAHNHPSGNPIPSEADREVTGIIQQALALVDIDVVDHIVIGQRENFSFAEMKLL